MQNINMLQMITVVAAKLRLKEESFPYYSCFQLFMVANHCRQKFGESQRLQIIVILILPNLLYPSYI
jgi:hypothetical protein